MAAVCPLPSSPHHAYLVRLDEPHPRVLLGTVPFELSFRHYTADELEPIE